MRTLICSISARVLLMVGLLAGCESPTTTSPVDGTPVPSFAMAPAALVAGSGHIERFGELRSFSLNARVAADGSTTGSFQLYARGSDIKIHGTVLCATVFGNTAWFGGVVTSEGSLQGVDVVWRAADLGSGKKGYPDLISLMTSAANLGFGDAFAYCAATPGRPFLNREIQGDITVNSPGNGGFTAVDIAEVNVGVFVPCALDGAGEFVLLNGSLQFLFHVSEDVAGGFHFKTETNPQGLSGYGQTSGDSYQGTGNTGGGTNGSFSGLPFTESFVNNFRIIGQGPGNNYVIHTNAQFTVNANGTVVVSNVKMTADCM
jgi:hypothetical protein